MVLNGAEDVFKAMEKIKILNHPFVAILKKTTFLSYQPYQRFTIKEMEKDQSF